MGTVTDLVSVTGVAEIVVDGELLWVSPGLSEHGRYWALFTPADVRVGVVTEHADGTADVVVGTETWPAGSVQAAAERAVAVLRGAFPCHCGCGRDHREHTPVRGAR
ncbi:hypothetical protein RMN57_12960 [Kitasatospora sp. CM 4170]|uniref:Uncharacterized protein n=1 Tax=Kitasatospora aburaviensis TaxID=67265 RepID=A0ABW1F2Z8_9ACTN|nr:hypothetical protein [Kitasatospora sp. CM 4170]WNM45563.1 hypothetical protein RMN57_12960 [Kitasatospora sp. CM 4170]